MSALRQIRMSVFNVSQAEMASVVGVSQATISRWESGQFEPDRKHLENIRKEAFCRGLSWSDTSFFAVGPATETAPS
jgi:transcriptional regulator with XRE-family HTH domain